MVFVTCAAPLLAAVALSRPVDAQERQQPKSLQTEGGKVFESRCSTCHGLDGRGGEHAPNIATNPAIARLSDAALSRIIGDGIPSAGMPSFRELGPENIEAVVARLRILQGVRPATATVGNPVQGKRLFFGKAECSSCHMVDGTGGFLGPDLSAYSRNHSTGQITDAIVNPNKNLGPGEGAVVVVTRDGKRFVGIGRNEDNFSLQLLTQDGIFHLFMKPDLASVRHENRSLMPADYASRLSSAEINDLISFLEQASEQSSKEARRETVR